MDFFNRRRQSGLGGILGGLLGGRRSNYYATNRRQTGSRGLLNNPIAQAAIGGLIGYGINRFISGRSNRINSSNIGGSTWGQNSGEGVGGSTWGQDTGNGGSVLPGFENERTS